MERRLPLPVKSLKGRLPPLAGMTAALQPKAAGPQGSARSPLASGPPEWIGERVAGDLKPPRGAARSGRPRARCSVPPGRDSPRASVLLLAAVLAVTEADRPTRAVLSPSVVEENPVGRANARQ